jgi:hypothetical protein
MVSLLVYCERSQLLQCISSIALGMQSVLHSSSLDIPDLLCFAFDALPVDNNNDFSVLPLSVSLHGVLSLSAFMNEYGS